MAAPSKLTKEVIVKLEEVAALDGSVEEMAYYCDVSRQTIYQWLKDNPKLSDKIERLRQRPILKARQTAIKGVGESYTNAMDYLKRKKKLEFGDNIDVTSDGKPLSIKIVNTIDDGDNDTA